MDKYIDADKLKKAFDQTSAREDGYYPNNVVDYMPAADVRENVRGEWLLTLSDVYDFYKCSVCGHRIEAPGGAPHENFCPNCGADMRSENDAEKET